MRRLGIVLIIVGFIAIGTSSVTLATAQGSGGNNPGGRGTSTTGSGPDAAAPTRELADGTALQVGANGTAPANNLPAPTRELATAGGAPGPTTTDTTQHAPASRSKGLTPEQRLATLQADGFIPEAKPPVAENDPRTVAIKQQLDGLAARCMESPDQLADLTVEARAIKAKHGINSNDESVLASVRAALPAGTAPVRCNALFTSHGQS